MEKIKYAIVILIAIAQISCKDRDVHYQDMELINYPIKTDGSCLCHKNGGLHDS